MFMRKWTSVFGKTPLLGYLAHSVSFIQVIVHVSCEITSYIPRTYREVIMQKLQTGISRQYNLNPFSTLIRRPIKFTEHHDEVEFTYYNELQWLLNIEIWQYEWTILGNFRYDVDRFREYQYSTGWIAPNMPWKVRENRHHMKHVQVWMWTMVMPVNCWSPFSCLFTTCDGSPCSVAITGDRI